MSPPPLRVLLVDDHEVVRSGIAAMLKATEDIVVAGDAEAAAYLARHTATPGA